MFSRREFFVTPGLAAAVPVFGAEPPSASAYGLIGQMKAAPGKRAEAAELIDPCGVAQAGEADLGGPGTVDLLLEQAHRRGGLPAGRAVRGRACFQ